MILNKEVRVMKKYGAVWAFCAFASMGVSANERISDTNGLEKQYVRCMEGGFESGCFAKIFSGHFDKWYKEPEKAPISTEAFYRKWLNGQSVYKVHVIDKVVKAGVFDNRSYLIERADGELSGIFIGLRKIQGDWYVYDIQGGSSDAYVRELLDMPRINASGK